MSDFAGDFMRGFMDENFLLGGETARALFKQAAAQPIFDYHCHLSPREIYEDKPFSDLSDLWLGGDHYKWRAMRSFGIDEKYVTGESTGYEKFKAWAQTLPYCIGNPLYHWTHLELQRFFGIDTPLSPKTADEIWKKANTRIAADGFTPRRIIKNSNVAALCTTDDPADSLEYHQRLAEDASFGVQVLPAFRPDKALNPTAAAFRPWLETLAVAAGMKIKRFGDLKEALARRIGFFAGLGCVASDHAFTYVPFSPAEETELEQIFQRALEGWELGRTDIEKYQTALLGFLAAEYHRHNIAMELHIGAMRNNNTRWFESLGPDTGFDSADDRTIARPLARFLDSLEYNGTLPKTILFTLNPKDNCVLASMIGNFHSNGIPGKLQFGTAWWMNDHLDGMRRQMTDLASVGVLGKFLGMVTDSRSFLSYPRHEYFRRILCDMLGQWVESGQYPDDRETLGDIVCGISFKNARSYFGIH